MIGFLRWLRSTLLGLLNAAAKFVVFLIVAALILGLIGLARGDGLPGTMVLTLDLRQAIADSTDSPAFGVISPPVTVMNLLFALQGAEKDARVKGVLVRLGGGGVSVAQAQEIGAAFVRFRQSGKFVIAQATDFSGSGLGDYLAAAAADQIWVQPKADFAVSGPGGAEIFLRGLFDKVQAEPQIAKRAEYKSAADMFMEKTMSAPDREQLTLIMQSWYGGAVASVAAARKLGRDAVASAFEASPQFSEDAKKEGLVDEIGYDDDARAAALARAGHGAKAVKISDYIEARGDGPQFAHAAPIAVIEAAGEIRDGGAGGGLLGAAGIASDDLSCAIRQAAKDKNVKAIILRIDSPGGSVSASDQILDAVKKAQAAGKKVVVSMGATAASGGYYISASADRIVAEPGTLTGSIGVLTGKVSIGKSLELIGVHADEVAVGKNALMDSSFSPYTPDQWVALNREADTVYGDFLQKVASGRKLPLDTVGALARGRVWTGADARARGLVDATGGFWTAAQLAANLAGIDRAQMKFKRYTAHRGFLERITGALQGTGMEFRGLANLAALMRLPALQGVLAAAAQVPQGGIEMKAVNLPR